MFFGLGIGGINSLSKLKWTMVLTDARASVYCCEYVKKNYTQIFNKIFNEYKFF